MAINVFALFRRLKSRRKSDRRQQTLPFQGPERRQGDRRRRNQFGR